MIGFTDKDIELGFELSELNEKFNAISQFASKLLAEQQMPPREFEVTFRKNIKKLFVVGDMDV